MVIATAGCADDPVPSAVRGPTSDEMPARVAVAGGPLAVGFALGRVAFNTQVPPFDVSRHPITVGRYRECVRAGVCAPPADQRPACDPARGESQPRGTDAIDGRTYSDRPESAELPLTCATPDQAEAYCRWVGGTIPTPEQWLLASRGPEVRRYAWGTDPAMCARHPRAHDCPPIHDPLSVYRVGAHTEAGSPFGVEDVLLAPTELVRGTKETAVSSCQADGIYCQVGSYTEPAGIDMMWKVQPSPVAAKPGIASATFGFRCVWEVK